MTGPLTKPLPEPDAAEYPRFSTVLVLAANDDMPAHRRAAARAAVLAWCDAISEWEPKLADAYRARWL